MDYDGSLWFSHPGLQREAIRCVTHRGDGVQLWLPWCTAAALDPLFRMEDAYGTYGIDNIKTRADCHSLYSRRLGIVRIPEGRIVTEKR